MNKNITALILIVLGIGIYFTYTQSQIYDTDLVLLSTNDQYVKAISNAQSLETVRGSVQAANNKISTNDLARLDKMIPSSVDNIHLIVDLSALANRDGVTIKNIKADIVDTGKAASQQNNATANSATTSALLPNMLLGNIKLSFTITSGYGRFVSFLQDIERDLRIIDVTKIVVKASDTGAYDFNVEANAYWLQQ
ncbi:MAG: hypothetical protein WCO48_01115 [Candidatus Taylorbacteria bacterium]